MDVVDRLTRAHDFLRSQLRLLESALGMDEEARFVSREVSFTFWKELQAHCRREAETFVTCCAALGAGEGTPVMVDHAAEQEALLIVKQLFLKGPRSFEALRSKLAETTAKLHREMDRQEHELFPVLQHLLAFHDSAELEAHPVLSALTETMSVQDVITRYPKTRNTFETLFIDSRLEGYDCLEEVAWRHGMESHELLTALDEAVARVAAPSVHGQEAPLACWRAEAGCPQGG